VKGFRDDALDGLVQVGNLESSFDDVIVD